MEISNIIDRWDIFYSDFFAFCFFAFSVCFLKFFQNFLVKYLSKMDRLDYQSFSFFKCEFLLALVIGDHFGKTCSQLVFVF